MHDLLTTPDDFADHLERYAASVIVGVTYGRRVLDIHNDHVVEENKVSMTMLTNVNIPGKYLVESLPLLKHTPELLAPWKTMVRQQRKRDVAYLTGLVDEVKDKMARGVAPNSFAKQLLEQRAAGKLDMTELEIAYACGTPFGAGVETSSGTLLCFLLACAEFGQTFIKRAQEEIDGVVGSDRLPSFDDYEELPFVQAIVKETLRWRPIAVLGVSGAVAV